MRRGTFYFTVLLRYNDLALTRQKSDHTAAYRLKLQANLRPAAYIISMAQHHHIKQSWK
jgi:hypothetical protein